MIGYGDIRIQSAGRNTEFIIKNIDKPNVVRAKINEAVSGEVTGVKEEI